MDSKILARVGAAIFAGLALAAGVIELTRKDQQPVERPAARFRMRSTSLLKAELVRCQRLGEAGPRDPNCLKAWDESRRHFLGIDRGEPAPTPSLAPKAADAASSATQKIPDPLPQTTAPADATQPDKVQ